MSYPNKILQLTFYDPYKSPGVLRKHREFSETMYSLCEERQTTFRSVNIFTPEGNKGRDFDNTGFFQQREIDSNFHKVFSGVRFLRAFLRVRPVFECAYEELRQFAPDILLWRYDLLTIPGLFNPKKVLPDLVFISEHQSKEMDELKVRWHDRMMYPFVRLQEKLLFDTIDAVVGVTSEIAEYETGKSDKYIPSYVLSNGIEIHNCPQKKYTSFTGNTLRMVFLSKNTVKWHGIDRAIAGMAKYDGKINLELHIIGTVTDDIQNMVNTFGLQQNVIYHGLQYGKELDAIFDSMHIAIGTLGIHRKNLLYGATLKVREYMARGIPFVISHRDEDIDEDFPLSLSLPSNDEPIDMNVIIQFATEVYGAYGENIPRIMRDYALDHMNYEKKARGLLDFIGSLQKNYSGT